MRGIRRKYIALTATIILLFFFVVNLISQSDNSQVGSARRNVSYCVLLVQVALTVLIFRAKRNHTKNVLTGLIVLITVLYILVFLYFVITTLE